MRSLVEKLPGNLLVPSRYTVFQLLGRIEPEWRHLPLESSRRSVAIDVGANLGIYTRWLSKRFNKVIAFEPHPVCSRKISVWANGQPNVRLIESAAGEACGKAVLNVPLSPTGTEGWGYGSIVKRPNNTKAYEILVTSIDSLGLEEVDFIKIDVEGFEFSVLKGAEATLNRCHPLLLVEIEARHHSSENEVQSIFQWMADRQYKSYYLSMDTWFEIPSADFGAIANRQRSQSSAFVINFLFAPNSKQMRARHPTARGELALSFGEE